MTESTQILLFAVVVILTVLLTIIGWQIFQILTEIRKMMRRFNSMLDEAAEMTGNLGKSFENLTGFSEGVKAVFTIFKLFGDKKGKKNV